MFSQQLDTNANLQGIAVAFCVPLAAATNWCLLQHAGHAPNADHSDMPLALLLGALLSAVATLPLALPLQASLHDLSLLAGLGLFQLTLPCLLVVRLSRELSGAELSLLGLLEVIFGVLWAWLGAGEDPSSSTLVGGAMVLAALIGNELLARKITSPADMPIVSTPNSRSQA
jgi:drug/metabolite transporter (DMT)-like permease